MIAFRFALPVLLCLPLLTGCDRQSGSTTGQELADDRSNGVGEERQADLQTASIGPLRFDYDHHALTLIEMPIVFPIGPQKQAWGAKLVPAERAERLGQPGCTYGDPPRRRTCNARDEGGLALSLLERPIGDYRQDFVRAGLGAQLIPGRLDNAVGFAYTRTRLGQQALYRFIPVGERTLMLAEHQLVTEDPAARAAILETIRSLARAVQGDQR